MKQRVAFLTLGCRANQFDTASISDAVEHDTELVDFEDEADVYVINTCTVTHRADANARNLIRKARRRNPDAKVIVTGCMAQTQPDAVAAIDGVDLVVGNSHKDRLPELLVDPERITHAPRIAVKKLGFKRQIPDLPKISRMQDKTRAFVKIQDGCDYSCTFCIITIARGANASLSVDDLVDQVRRLGDAGFHEVVLTGVQIGRYGHDLEPRTTLVDALRRLLDETDMPRIRLSSIDPREVGDDLIALMADNPRICPHLHIPIQSGDDAILLLMKRNHDRAFMRDLFGRIRDQIPDVMIGSDVIVGFPGEGPSEFDMTIDFVEQWIDHVHVFSYSDRPGTVASGMDDKVPPEVIARRSQVLRDIGQRKRMAFGQRLVGRVEQVLTESRPTDDGLLAYTVHYMPVTVRGDVEPNRLVDVSIDIEGEQLVGAIAR
ncbi:MAG: tRNA (N(6)-L-threonylcarbamoyladenosine(37)-C(2))-methylthiotransferase MtaB [Candidatus Dadabacteria bacterium]|nr:MAG: tRNA (N(6)-L-threonylcarbamoyladenosine(37)-C(2))-methylthiotransferase MtaB [Candidatus Dadabacteria bacterium]